MVSNLDHSYSTNYNSSKHLITDGEIACRMYYTEPSPFFAVGHHLIMYFQSKRMMKDKENMLLNSIINKMNAYVIIKRVA